ncbi:MAG: hypothetical protein NUV82_04530 [Candidatus Komeilibacteria bacterium]|nr:hypothetical protein [Candidatus Komeilibacteria bacterium]
MDFLLQWLAGIYYLFNKVFLSLSERSKLKEEASRARQWRISAWVVYLLGLPPWVIIFINEHNWIAAMVEASGAPGMTLGLILAYRGVAATPPKWLNRLALMLIPIGFGISLYDFGGLTTITQWLEILLVLGFLIGTYLLAHERLSGYVWYLLMHVSCAWLMLIQGYDWLFAQQLISLIFITDAYVIGRRLKIKIPN